MQRSTGSILFDYNGTSIQGFLGATISDEQLIQWNCCAIQFMQYKEWASHEETVQHKQLLERELTLVDTETALWQRRKEVSRWAPRVASLPLQAQRDDATANLLRYMLDLCSPLCIPELPLDQKAYLDRIVLLKLVFWKAACLSHPKRLMADAMETGMTSGWKAVKDDLRTNNKYTCILPKVLQFIGPFCQDAHVESAQIDEKAPFTDPRKSPYTALLSARQHIDFIYYCSCCEARMSRDDWIAHEATSDHVSKRNQARQVLRDERRLWHHRSHVRLPMPRVASLSLREHQNDVYLLLFRYVCNIDETLGPVQGVLETYEFMERVTMLLLAIWKANCVLQPPYPLHDALDWNEWTTKGWKEMKQQMLSSKVFLVCSLVVEYLKDGASA